MKVKSQRMMPPCLAAEADVPRKRVEQKSCKVDTCLETTWKGKPYCEKHVLNHPYVQDLLSRMEHRIAEDALVRQRGANAVNVDSPGITLKEILRVLKQKKHRTEERLERDLQLPRNLIHNYCVALQNRGIVKIRMTERGGQRVTFLLESEEIED